MSVFHVSERENEVQDDSDAQECPVEVGFEMYEEGSKELSLQDKTLLYGGLTLVGVP